MAKFKVRRDALFAQSASVKGTLLVDGGMSTTSGSTTTFSGGLTAASTFTVTGSAIIGSGGTAIAGILAGSFSASTPAISSSNAGTASAAITGVTQNHKIFISPSAMSACLVIYEVGASPGGGVVTFNLYNSNDEDVAEDTGGKFAYLAILDK